MSHLFNDKIIAITGGASGIGLETAKLLASRGAKLSLADVSEENLEAAVLAIEASSGPGSVISTTLDVRDREAVEKWIAETVSTFVKSTVLRTLQESYLDKRFKRISRKSMTTTSKGSWALTLPAL